MPSQPDRSMKYIQKQISQKRNRAKGVSKQKLLIRRQRIRRRLKQQADKAIKLLEQEFVTCVDSGGKVNNMSRVSKGMALKGKSAEKRK